MGNFLDKVAIGAATTPVLGLAPVVGTGLAVLGVCKLVKIIFDKSESKPVEVEIEEEEDEPQITLFGTLQLPISGEEKTTTGDVAKAVGWIFGGMLIKDVCHAVRSFASRHILKMFYQNNLDMAKLWGTISSSMRDISALSCCADDGKRVGMTKAVEFMAGNLARNGFYEMRWV